MKKKKQKQFIRREKRKENSELQTDNVERELMESLLVSLRNKEAFIRSKNLFVCVKKTKKMILSCNAVSVVLFMMTQTRKRNRFP